MTSQRWSDSLKALSKLGLLVRLEKTTKCTKSTHYDNPTSYLMRDEKSAVRNVIDKQKQIAERLHIIGMLSTQEYNKHNKNKCSVACTKCPTQQSVSVTSLTRTSCPAKVSNTSRAKPFLHYNEKERTIWLRLGSLNSNY